MSINPQNDLAELAKVLDLPKPPLRIEGFDISNISGTFAVASLVSFKNGRPDRANYRRFKIKTVEGQDDFAASRKVSRDSSDAPSLTAVINIAASEKRMTPEG